MTVRPDYQIEVRRDVLEESDGPMLIHGFQGFHGKLIRVPSRHQLRPDAHLLACWKFGTICSCEAQGRHEQPLKNGRVQL